MKKFSVTGWVFHPAVEEEIDISIFVEDLSKAKEELAQAYRDLTKLPKSQRCDVTISSIEEVYE